MGFGSYDESEQERQTQNDEEDREGLDGGDEGEFSFESTATTEELVGKLEEMRDADEDDE